MQAEWQAHLKTYQANIQDSTVIDYGHPQDELKAVNGNIVADLNHFGLISAEGQDTSDFLQGQFSNDVRLVTEEKSQLNSYCNPKGRILASFRLFSLADRYYLEMPQPLIEATLKRLRMFVMRSQVTLEDASHLMVRIGVAGPDSKAFISELGLGCPEEIDSATVTDDVTVLAIPGTTPRFEIHGPVDKLKNYWDKLAEKNTPVGADVWALHDIQAGLPIIQSETVESFVPQMVNLELINGVSFKKGCYPGQEIVARMQYLGKLKKRMFRAHVDTADAIQAGENLYSGSSENSQSIGNIVNAKNSPDGGYDVLAVIQITEAETGEVRLGNKNGSILEISELPYSLSA